MNADGIAFHSMIISGRGQHVLPQANDFEFYDKNLSANVPTNLTDGLCCLHKVDFAIVNTLHAKRQYIGATYYVELYTSSTFRASAGELSVIVYRSSRGIPLTTSVISLSQLLV